ncbi:MAG TPA: bacillithiol biosynthesis cysteine-adding enzyme BshC [Gemmatimonadales bacterium]|nr:bacillithiol biosynthesis cysteine-adding enzyme BshC [Gemmatimonadales bacterium]
MTLRIVPTPLEARVTDPVPRPGTLAAGLEAAFVPSSARDDAVARLRAPGALAVTTGQQPGLFTGPLYTVYKALSAASLARVLERRWGRPVVPVFWSAGDDHDYAEASHAAWIGPDGGVTTAALPPRPPEAPLTPMYQEPLGPGLEPALALLEEGLPPSEFREATLAWLRRHYRADATVAGAYAGALAELVAPLGVVVLDSAHPAVKRAAAPFLLRALEQAAELDADLDRHAEAHGVTSRTSGIVVGDGASLVMLEAAQGRDRLVAHDGGFSTRRSRERLVLDDLRRIAEAEPARLSPNVLLRPVVESALLPTVAYVAGPGELRYLGLTPPIYNGLGVARQLPLPRWSGLLVETRVDRVLEKFGIALEELLEPAGALEARLVRSQLPPEVTGALAGLRAAVEEYYDVLARHAVSIDPTLERPLQGARHQALAGSQEVEKKLVQHLKKRQETELGQIARARALVLPGGKPQERVLTVASFLARHGPGLLVELSAAVESWYAGALEGASQPA